jgi:predicted ABC-type transport system involved in lysophospholipase L1 biosynthesis ATPase subunit
VTDAGFVLTAWIGTGVVLVAYVARIAQRTRRAERLTEGER